ncbi:MAG: NADH-quinone oxidoreductase subunit NuoE [Rhizobiaceae bacterium]|nr:NADH-quinone oxidoreductase subunit NuoE [Rhizobiaceae bacterium]
MSVRRLAEPALQPPAFAFNKAMAEQAKTWIKKYPKGREQSAVIPLLMLAQEQEGWVTRAAIEHVADTLGMPYIRVLEVATFYTQFQLKPVGTRAHIQVCGTTPCMLRGAEELKEVCRNKIHHEQFHTNEDGTLSWEEVECLGACVNAPMVMIFKDTYEDLTPERLAEIIDEFEAGRGAAVPTGPQTERWFSAPASGFTSLADEQSVTKVASGKAKAKARTPSDSASSKKTV